MIELRPYQVAGVEEIRAAFARGVRRICYTLPTGGGKTCLFAYITARMSERNKRVCVLVHREELIKQVSDALSAQNVPHGIIKAGMDLYPRRSVQVASVQSLRNRLDRYERFDLMIPDECHHAVSNVWNAVLTYYNTNILGVTATLTRLDGRGLGSCFDEHIPGPTTPELIQQGYLVPPLMYAPTEADFSSLRSHMGDYIRSDAAQVMDTATIYGDAISYYRKYAANLPSVAFCVTVAHAEKTAERFRADGIASVSIDGSLDTYERQRRLAALRSGEVKVLTSCDLISEGFDVPGLYAALLLRPTKSLVTFLQQCGRVLRPAPGKTRAIILDHVGNWHRHGHPAWAREWTLTTDRPKQPKPAIATCLACYAVYDRSEPCCPVCGAIGVSNNTGQRSALRQRDAELQLIDANSPWANMDYRSAIRRARTEAELRELAKARGYKPGWVYHMMQKRGMAGASK